MLSCRLFMAELKLPWKSHRTENNNLKVSHIPTSPVQRPLGFKIHAVHFQMLVGCPHRQPTLVPEAYTHFSSLLIHVRSYLPSPQQGHCDG